MNLGDRVQIVDGVIKGELATITPDPISGNHIETDDGLTEVHITFDKDGVHLGISKGYAILVPCWMSIQRIKVL